MIRFIRERSQQRVLRILLWSWYWRSLAHELLLVVGFGLVILLGSKPRYRLLILLLLSLLLNLSCILLDLLMSLLQLLLILGLRRMLLQKIGLLLHLLVGPSLWQKIGL